ncbi:hypothetical protein [Ethanoligenens sp.]
MDKEKNEQADEITAAYTIAKMEDVMRAIIKSNEKHAEMMDKLAR